MPNLLKYADVQMAAEAFLVQDEATGQLKSDLKTALIEGNNHTSKFTATQATDFLSHWEVVAQKPNTSTGFSGTLFKYIGPTDVAKGLTNGELVMSLRSTEFIDDAARDNQATNVLEIKETGFAWGQVRDMEDWYAQLKASGQITAGQTFGLTGYSLGGHLASVFSLLHQGEANISRVVTFNGAGIGAVESSSYATQIVDASLNALYVRVSAAMAAGNDISNNLAGCARSSGIRRQSACAISFRKGITA